MFRTHTLQMADTYSQTFLPLFPLIFSPSSILPSVPHHFHSFHHSILYFPIHSPFPLHKHSQIFKLFYLLKFLSPHLNTLPFLPSYCLIPAPNPHHFTLCRVYP